MGQFCAYLLHSGGHATAAGFLFMLRNLIRKIERGRSFAARIGENMYFQKALSCHKVVNINATTQLQVVLVKPERFDDAAAIADQLNAKRTVVLNLESTNKEVSRRLIDFLSGVAYANNGQIKRVATSTFIITPYNVDIMGDLLDELENNGVFF